MNSPKPLKLSAIYHVNQPPIFREIEPDVVVERIAKDLG
jgi:hypothetical protein